jgi:hypothetical protein
VSKHNGAVLSKNYEVDQFVKSVATDLRNGVRSSAGLESFIAFTCRQNVRSRRRPTSSMNDGGKIFQGQLNWSVNLSSDLRLAKTSLQSTFVSGV